MLWLADLDILTAENIERVGVPGIAVLLLIAVIYTQIKRQGAENELKALTSKIQAETEKTRAEAESRREDHERKREEQFLLTIAALTEGVSGIRKAVEAMPPVVTSLDSSLKALQTTTTDLHGIETKTNVAVANHHTWAEESVSHLTKLSQGILDAVRPLPESLGEIKGQLLSISSQLLAMAIVTPAPEAMTDAPAAEPPAEPPAEAAPAP